MSAAPDTVVTGGVQELIEDQYRRRAAYGIIGIKVNLYLGIDVDAVALALANSDIRGTQLECVMVGDSYFMTHLGRASTRLAPGGEQEWGLTTLAGLVREVREALDRWGAKPGPSLVADLPDGSTRSVRALLDAASRMAAAGSDIVKLEIEGDQSFRFIEVLRGASFEVMAHLGYTPQSGRLRRWGDTIDEAEGIFAAARRARDAGASSIVLEMVSEPVNRALSRPRTDGLPVYSIFSGRSQGGGQCLNIWDSIIRPPAPSPAFPPTAHHSIADFDRVYTPTVVASHLGALWRLVAQGLFPPPPRSRLAPDVAAAIADFDPWHLTRRLVSLGEA